MFRLFPLLVVPVAIYNLFALGGSIASRNEIEDGHNKIQTLLSDKLSFTVKMFSGDPWTFSFSDFLLLFGVAMLFIEVVKATRTTSNELINHGLSMLVFVVALVEFITL